MDVDYRFGVWAPPADVWGVIISFLPRKIKDDSRLYWLGWIPITCGLCRKFEDIVGATFPKLENWMTEAQRMQSIRDAMGSPSYAKHTSRVHKRDLRDYWATQGVLSPPYPVAKPDLAKSHILIKHVAKLSEKELSLVFDLLPRLKQHDRHVRVLRSLRFAFLGMWWYKDWRPPHRDGPRRGSP